MPMLFVCHRVSQRTVEAILRSHSSEILSTDKDDIFRLKVRRRHIWEDALNYFRKGIPTSKHLRVTFLGEPAVDAGGPLREFFRLLLGELSRNNSLFCGEETARAPLHNVLALSKNTFKHVGCMMAASLLNGGPAPSFFADFVADYIAFGIGKLKVSVQDVIDPNMKEKLIKVNSRLCL